MTRAILLGALVAACTGPDPGAIAVPRALDRDAYVHDVHPILEARCATLDCHGRFDRPLRLYSETGLRRSDELRDQPITAQELTDDVAALAAVDLAPAVEQTMILEKPLGLVKHTGGALFTGTSDPQYVCLRGWLAGVSADADVASACAIAATQVALPAP